MESIAKISSLMETARELTLDAAQATRGARTSTRPLDRNQMRKLLDSRNDREVLEGLRRVMAMMYRNHKTLPLFSNVVKNVASPNLEIKKLVYIYLIHHAEQEPDLALLSINTIQKSLSDTNPQVRALALKTMSGIRVPVISQIVSLAIKKGVADMSPYVRKAAALAIPKCHRLDPSQAPQLIEYLATLLGDRQYYVAGAAVSAMLEICPDRIDLIHKHYRALAKQVVDMDEWSQLATLRMMTSYARKCFPRRPERPIEAAEESQETRVDDFYGESRHVGRGSSGATTLDPDLALFLNNIKPLLQSRNAGVVVAVTRCYADIGTADYVKLAIGPLVALLRSAPDIQQTALFNIVSVCLIRPADFVKYASHFLVRATDPEPVWELKLEVLTIIFPHSPAHIKSLILKELEHFSQGTNKVLVREAVRAIGRCAQSDAATAPRCLKLLLGQITSLDGNLAAESLTVIRHLIQQDAQGHTGTVVRLAKNLDSATDPQARATIIWLVGEFSGLNGEDNIAPDVLRILAKDFPNESPAAKQQILLLAAKVYLHHLNRKSEADKAREADEDPPIDMDTHPVERLWEYVLLLVRYDTSFDLRDRARMYRSLLTVPQLATLMLLAEKPAPQAPSPSESRKGFTLGSATLVLAGGGGIHGLQGYEPLPDWVEEGKQPNPRLREPDGGQSSRYDVEKSSLPASERLDEAAKSVVPTKTNGTGEVVGAKTLNDWLDEEESEESEEESEEESTDEEEEEDDEDDDDDDEEEEEEEETESDDDGEADRLVKS
ncbi:adaptin N terminal region-domain-containing protein [Dactylonectria estremocensis]|uniref:AP complex subunit beta n=1 Tax=Dactylonectria estremocensis TaxID=1079267 RepID=A0A9P9F3F8_9HYPO|nr:adaptin N terminal region-domain-containing protein [Dactylonectria estremocensis]